MNDNLKDFVNNIGVLCETWLVVYNKFIQSGLDPKSALSHTKEFMSAFIAGAIQNNGGRNGEV